VKLKRCDKTKAQLLQVLLRNDFIVFVNAPSKRFFFLDIQVGVLESEIKVLRQNNKEGYRLQVCCNVKLRVL